MFTLAIGSSETVAQLVAHGVGEIAGPPKRASVSILEHHAEVETVIRRRDKLSPCSSIASLSAAACCHG
ncbi:MAG: hypothetical protein U1E17_04905 [Geminicoccaceae bacterium]